ncbi:putative alpha/beta fold family hydrolase [Cladophialophora carrionii]|uniref:Putative alpha/beta fold family hydrolase n=1 Tax=Cladophialophora carrionii TaxID=86049 RepID=A0A1C1CQF2_9EURO|nr:putative alpha/beta fold family hydrolase [Cladophialophora carrionii]
MASSVIGLLFRRASFYAFGFFNWCLFLGLFIKNGTFFKKDTEQDELQFAIERDRFWNLAKAPLPGFKHYFYTLRNDLKLHYISNRATPSRDNLVIFFHGFPDSSMMWRHLMQEPAMPLRDATLVCVDLPGYGGSDSFKKYDTEVLEALTEFVVAMRDKYIPPEASEDTNTFIVGHDWGCVLGFRLAAEASSLADRFILTNAPHVELAFANKDRILNSASKIFKQFKHAPKQNFGCLSKAFNALKPLMMQTMLMGYIFAFHLPAALVKYLGVAGNYSFVRGANRSGYGKGSKEYRVQECMASSFGPGPEECRTSTSTINGTNGVDGEKHGETYGSSVLERAKSPGEAFWNMTAYYRDGAGWRPWAKSLETITDLYALETSASESSSPGRRRSSVSNSLFLDQYKGSLHAPTYVLWGEKDQACSRPICLDGIGDYLAKDSEVTLLPRSGHWTPVQRDARPVLATVIGLFAGRDAKPFAMVTPEVQKVYDGAVLMVKK